MHQIFLADTRKPCTYKQYHTVFVMSITYHLLIPGQTHVHSMMAINTKQKAAAREEARTGVGQNNGNTIDTVYAFLY
jgi:hypothetical protein